MNTEKAKILLVDDDMDIITVMETILVKEGYKVITAGSKAEGIELAKAEKPDLAILDVMMSTHYEGFELALEMHKNVNTNTIPVIIQSSIDVFVTNNPSVQQMAREFRKNPEYKDMQVLLLKNVQTGEAGVDYLAEDGAAMWVPVNGFLRKPVDPAKLLPEVEKLISVRA